MSDVTSPGGLGAAITHGLVSDSRLPLPDATGVEFLEDGTTVLRVAYSMREGYTITIRRNKNGPLFELPDRVEDV